MDDGPDEITQDSRVALAGFAVAAQMEDALRDAFPGVAFEVDSLAFGDSIRDVRFHVSWKDGPGKHPVETAVAAFLERAGHAEWARAAFRYETQDAATGTSAAGVLVLPGRLGTVIPFPAKNRRD